MCTYITCIVLNPYDTYQHHTNKPNDQVTLCHCSLKNTSIHMINHYVYKIMYVHITEQLWLPLYKHLPLDLYQLLH